MRQLAHTLLAWSFVIAGFLSQRESVAPFVPGPAQFTFTREADCLEVHRQFSQVGFITLPRDPQGRTTCWDTETAPSAAR